jgi:hypothetical protein
MGLIAKRAAEYPAGSFVSVWTGAFTGSPGVPPVNAEGRTCRVDHWNSVGQAYVYFLGGTNGLGNCGRYVYGSAILRRVPVAELFPDECSALLLAAESPAIRLEVEAAGLAAAGEWRKVISAAK